MKRLLRNALFLLLGLLIGGFSVFASAANIKLSGPGSITQSGNQYYRSNGNPTTTYSKSSVPAPSEVLSDSKVLMKRVFDVAEDTPTGKLSGQIIDAMEVPKSTFGSVLKDAVKGGLKPGGIVGAIVIGLATDWMINKGFQWMEDGQNWMKPGTPETIAGTWRDPYDGFDAAASVVVAHAVQHLGWANIPYYYYLDGASFIRIKRNDGNGSYILSKVSYTTPAPAPQPATQADLDASMDDLATQKLKEVADAFMKDQTVLPIPDDAKSSASPIGSLETPEKEMSKEERNNPDGSKDTTRNTQKNVGTTSGGDPVTEPITLNINTVNNSTTTNNVTNQTTSTTTTKPADKNDAPPVWTDTAMPEVSTLYQQKYPDGIKGVWNAKSAALKQTAFIQSLQSLVPSLGAGQCPAFSLNLDNGWVNDGTREIPVPCWIYSFIKAVLMISTAFLCRALIFGG